ncbi:MAG: hypothetical protein WBQ75_11880 [Acetobacteraceae bacterium]
MAQPGSSEFAALWRQTELPKIVRALAARGNEGYVRTLLSDILHYGFGAHYLEIDHEVRMPEVRGSASGVPPPDRNAAIARSSRRRRAWPSLSPNPRACRRYATVAPYVGGVELQAVSQLEFPQRVGSGPSNQTCQRPGSAHLRRSAEIGRFLKADIIAAGRLPPSWADYEPCISTGGYMKELPVPDGT